MFAAIRAQSTREKKIEKEMKPKWSNYAIENVTLFVKVNPGREGRNERAFGKNK